MSAEEPTDCSTGVFNEFGECQPVGSGFNTENGQPYPDGFPIGDFPDSCVEQWVLTGDCILTTIPEVTVGQTPFSVTLPATGTEHVVQASIIGTVLIISGLFLNRLTQRREL